MPSVFSHAVVGSTLVACGVPRPRAALVVLGAVLAVLPDLDVVGLAVGWGLDHPLGHRGLSHSLPPRRRSPALGRSRPRAGRAERRWRMWLVLALAAASHGLLDAMTNGGRGVAFLAPFVDTRWHFPVRPIEVSPIGVREFFSRRGLEVLTNEVVWLWAPCLARWPRRGRCAGSAIHERPQLARPVADLGVLHGAIEQRPRSRRLAAADQVERGVVGGQRRLPFGGADRRVRLRLPLGPRGLVEASPAARRSPPARARCRRGSSASAASNAAPPASHRSWALCTSPRNHAAAQLASLSSTAFSSSGRAVSSALRS